MLPQPSANFVPPPSRPSPCLRFVQQVWNSSTRQHANQTGKLRVTRRRKPKPDSSENKCAPTGALGNSQGVQRQAVSKKDQSGGLGRRAVGSVLGEPPQKTKTNVFVLAVKTANKQWTRKDRRNVHIPKNRFLKRGNLRSDAKHPCFSSLAVKGLLDRSSITGGFLAHRTDASWVSQLCQRTLVLLAPSFVLTGLGRSHTSSHVPVITCMCSKL